MPPLIDAPADAASSVAHHRTRTLVQQHTAAPAPASTAHKPNKHSDASLSLPAVPRSIAPSDDSYALRSELIPASYLSGWFCRSPAVRGSVRWLHSKVLLGQDSFLIGLPGPLRRWVALAYAEKYGREIAYLPLTRDSSESDLKQRREISANGTSRFVAQCVLEAALYGRLLILEGLEHAERNVLPVLNNLLENREMALEDGSFLVAPQRFAQLRREATERGESVPQRLISVHPDFRVIALGIPVPPLRGQPLDPPLRSRFQCHRIDGVEQTTLLRAMRDMLGERLPVKEVQKMLSFAEAVRSLTARTAATAGVENRTLAFQHLPAVPESGLLTAAQLLALFPGQPLEDALSSAFPWQVCVTNEEARTLLQKVWNVVITGTLSAAAPEAAPAAPPAKKEPAAAIAALLPSVPTLPPLDPSLPRFLLSGARRPDPTDEAEGVMGVRGPLPTDVVLEFKRTNSSASANASNSTAVVRVRVRGGSGSGLASSILAPPALPPFTGGLPHAHSLSGMLMSHALGRDICLLSGKGEGKTFLVRQFAAILGYIPEPIFLYKDMSARDLLQRRTAGAGGETGWVDSPLVTAIRQGSLAVLDGIDRLPPGNLGVLDRLICERELGLGDGTQFLPAARYDSLVAGGISRATLDERKVYRIHPSFRLICLAAPPDASNSWMSAELLHGFMFHVHRMSMGEEDAALSQSTKSLINPAAKSLLPSLSQILLQILPSSNPSFLLKLQRLHQRLVQLSRDPVIQLERDTLSLRQMLRVARYEVSTRQRLERSRVDAMVPSSVTGSKPPPASDPSSTLHTLLCKKLLNTLMVPYLPTSKREVLLAVLVEVGFMSSAEMGAFGRGESVALLPIKSENGFLSIGDISVPLHTPLHPELVPSDFVFYPIPLHVSLMSSILSELVAGENICLLGNQGVGKNKIVDRLLQLMGREREYIQLHRDTTVSSLTLSPSLQSGRLVFEDSPLLLAMLHGRILVIDEVDKAPLEVVVILKGLCEDGEIHLADGRRFVKRGSPIYDLIQKQRASSPSSPSSPASNPFPSFHLIHPSFLVIALANPPGFPFLGNDFFAQLGDVFSCLAVDNPDRISEESLVASYAPRIPAEVRARLVAVFQELRQLHREGVLSYPYSTRELVALVRHQSAHPSQPLAETLRNVLDFDSFDPHTLGTLLGVFEKHGIVTGALYKDQMQSVGEDINPASTGVVRGADGSLPVRLAKSFPLPQALFVGTLTVESGGGGGDSFDPTPSSSSSSLRPDQTVPGRLFTPQSYERPVETRTILGIDGATLKYTQALAPSAEGSSKETPPPPLSAAEQTQHLLSLSSSRSEFKACDRHYSARTQVFAEETFQFTHTGAGFLSVPGQARNQGVPLVPLQCFVPSFRPGFVHMLLVKPLALVTYDLTSSRPMWTSLPLTVQLVRFHLDEEFTGCSLLSVPSVGKLVVVVPQFMALLVVDSFTPSCTPLSLFTTLTGQSREADRFVDTSVPVLARAIEGTPFVVVAQQGSTRLSFINLASTAPKLPYATQSFSLNVKVFSIDVLHPDRLLVRDNQQRSHDLQLKFAASGLVDSIVVRSMVLRTVTDPPLVDLHIQSISGALDAAVVGPEYMRKDAAQRMAQMNTSAAGTGSWRYAAPSASSTSSSNSSDPKFLHLWAEEDLICGYMLGLAPAASSTPSATRLALYAHTRSQERAAASSSSSSDPASIVGSSAAIRTQTPSRSVSLFLKQSQVLLNVLSFDREVVLEIIDTRQGSMRLISLPRPPRQSNAEFSLEAQSEHHVLQAVELSDGRLALLHRNATVRVFELRESQLKEQELSWRSMLGAAVKASNAAAAGQSGASAGEQADFESDDRDSPSGGSDSQQEGGGGDDAENSGSGSGQGGEEGDGEGSGQGSGKGGVGGKGKGGKGKGKGGGKGGGGGSGAGGFLSNLDFNRKSTLTESQLRDLALTRVPLFSEADSDALLAKAKEAAAKATGKLLSPDRQKLGLDPGFYSRLYNVVARDIAQLRTVLESAEAREKERVWIRQALAGEVDETKLVDGATGAKNIYKRRGIEEHPPSGLQKRPKRLRFVMDCSSSMARFNAQDRRLDRMVATTVLIMESFSNLSHKFDYSIVGHDGGSPLIPLVEWGHPPRTQSERTAIIESMMWNASFCESGDHTLAAAAHAVTEVRKAEGDDYFVFVLSDANLGGYGITASSFASVLLADPLVNAYAIFIASESAALPLTRMLPLGHGHVVTDTSMLPRIFKGIFTEALASGRRAKL